MSDTENTNTGVDATDEVVAEETVETEDEE